MTLKQPKRQSGNFRYSKVKKGNKEQLKGHHRTLFLKINNNSFDKKFKLRTIDDVHEEKEDLTKDPSESNFLRAGSDHIQVHSQCFASE